MDETKTEGESTTIGVAKEELVKMQAPDDVTSVSVAGLQFDIPASGLVECPAHVAKELASHGFTVVPPRAPSSKGRARLQG